MSNGELLSNGCRISVFQDERCSTDWMIKWWLPNNVNIHIITFIILKWLRCKFYVMCSIPQLKVIVLKKKGKNFIQNKIKRMRKKFKLNLRSLVWKGS